MINILYKYKGYIMIKDKSFSAYILPVRSDGRVALLQYGENGFGTIGGRLDDGEDFITALKRELIEELGGITADLADVAVAVSVPYSFKHPNIARAEKRGAWNEEHHFFVAKMPNNTDLTFRENRPEKISVVWIEPKELLNPTVTPFEDMRQYYEQYIIPLLQF